MREGGVPSIFQVPELKKRILFTLGILAVYRIGAHIPTPGIDTVALAAFFAELSRGGGTLMQFFDLFTGGALSQLTIFALGIMPYISASIILELLTVAVPHLERLKKEGDSGRKKINQYTRYGTVFLSTVQGFGIAIGIEQMAAPTGALVVPGPGWGFRLMTVLTLVAGTSFIMWLGEQITERGIGNGISLIIFAGIVSGLPGAIINTFRLLGTGELLPFVMIVLAVGMVAVVALVVWFEAGQRRLRVQVREADGGPENGGRPGNAPALEGQHLGRHSAYLREFHDSFSCYDRAVLECGLAPAVERGAHAAEHLVCGVDGRSDLLFRLLLYSDHFQSDGRGGEFEKVRRLHTRKTSGPAHCGFYRSHPESADVSGRHLPERHRHFAHLSDPVVQRAVLLRRNGAFDCRGRGGGYPTAD